MGKGLAKYGQPLPYGKVSAMLALVLAGRGFQAKIRNESVMLWLVQKNARPPTHRSPRTSTEGVSPSGTRPTLRPFTENHLGICKCKVSDIIHY